MNTNAVFQCAASKSSNASGDPDAIDIITLDLVRRGTIANTLSTT